MGFFLRLEWPNLWCFLLPKKGACARLTVLVLREVFCCKSKKLVTWWPLSHTKSNEMWTFLVQKWLKIAFLWPLWSLKVLMTFWKISFFRICFVKKVNPVFECQTRGKSRMVDLVPCWSLELVQLKSPAINSSSIKTCKIQLPNCQINLSNWCFG